MLWISWEESVRHTCYHEAAHAVFMHHYPDLQLRFVEGLIAARYRMDPI